jgi:acyl-CoA hydrolase
MRTIPIADVDRVLGDVLRAAGAQEGSLDPVVRVVVSGNFATPWALLAAVDACLPAYRLYLLNAQPGIPVRDAVVHETSFVGPGMRHSPTLSYIPSRLSLVPALLRTGIPPDVVLLHTTPPADGRVSLGLEVNILPAAVEAARARGGVVLAQVNPLLPYTFGDGELSVDLIDYAVEVEEPLRTHSAGRPDAASEAIGGRVAELVPDGATLQMGIGAVPDAALPGLSGRRRLRVWSEMFSDGVLHLFRAGALDPDAVHTASFAFGTAELYDWLDHNPRIRMRRTETTNDPAVISRRPAMTSVNSALQVDLFGQVNASRLHARIYSGFGGQTDFLVGALHAPGGQAFTALRSWHPVADVSTIVPLLEEPSTSFQPSAVITEHGLARVWGRDEREQARALIDHAAHPDVREELREEARFLGLLRAPSA